MIIGIAGKGGSGKSTSAEVLTEEFGYTRGKFSGALKEMFRTFLTYRGAPWHIVERMVEGDLKELPTPLLNGKSPREFMQAIGEWGRREIHPDFWIDTEFEVQAGNDNLLFDDLRYPNEEAAIQKRGGFVVQLVGRSKDVNDHVSENFEPKKPTAVIDNRGTIEELQGKVRTLVKDMSWIDRAA